ncbi:hypothetical protein EIP86_001722 [Pleurotus ostreatoroseus]|nr:hypothetical protein EIP86_001722 [Pleurotus ostreatoroseus]
MVIGYRDLRKRLEEKGQKVVVLPQLQEANDLPCDTGSPREELEANPEYAGLDFSGLTPDWNSNKGFYAATTPALQQRARWVRRWLRDRPEREIVVVAHADILRIITEGYNSHRWWANAEVREYTFRDEEEKDVQGEAWVIPVETIAKKGTEAPSSSEMVH